MNRPTALLVFSFCLALVPLRAAKETWKDVKGTTFKGEPSAIVGPFALFKVDSDRGRVVLLDQLPEEECARFAAALRLVPVRSEVWKEATGELTQELAAGGCRAGDKLVKEDFASKPEPEFLVLVFANSGNGDGWKVLGDVGQMLRQEMKEYPGLIDGFFCGFGHSGPDHRNMAKSMNWPGLMIEMNQQSSGSLVGGFLRGNQPTALFVTRNGVPLLALQGVTAEDIQKFCGAVKEELALTLPTNQKAWYPRYHYERAARKFLHARGYVPPLLIGNPLRPDGLAQRKVARVHATLPVDAAGVVGDVVVENDSVMPEELKQPIAQALKRGAVVAPAVRDGLEIAGVYEYAVNVDLKNNKTQLKDLAGASEVRLKEWLVLKPVKVENVFDSSAFGVKQVLEDGSVLMKSVYVGAELSGAPSYKAQSYAFENDWFQDEDGGASSVVPAEGKVETISGTEHTWKKITVGSDGMIDFQTGPLGLNWVIAYAYTEFEAPKEGTAFICMGSDDSSKVWVNGRKVHQTWQNRPVVPDDDVFPVHVVKGKNRVLVKVQNFLMPGWGMAMRVLIP